MTYIVAAIGYAVMAAKRLGLKVEDIQRLESIMYVQMDLITEVEAEEVYRIN